MPPTVLGGATSNRVGERLRAVLRVLRSPLLGLSGIASVVLIWHVAVTNGYVSQLSVPLPADVGRRVIDLLGDGDFISEAGNSLWTWLISMVLVFVVAVPLGILFGWFRAMYRPASTVIHAGRSVPSTALIPVAILFFGLGTQMKVALVAYAIFWPMLLNAMYGAHGVDPQMVRVGRSLRWSRTKILFRIVLPSAAPSVATGARVAGAIALIVVLAAELLGASNGVGSVIVTYGRNEQPDFVYAGIVLVGAIGVVLNYALNFLERAALPWAPGGRQR